MITFIIIAAAVILLGGLLFIVYTATQHNKGEEIGRRTETGTNRTTPTRTEGSEPLFFSAAAC